MRENALHHRFERVVESGVGEDDVGTLSAEFEVDLRHVIGRHLHHELAGRNRSGEGDAVDAGV